MIGWDLETTGLSHRSNHIIEIGAVTSDETFQTHVNSVEEVPPFIVKFTGITTAQIRRAPCPGDALRRFFSFLQNSQCRYLVGYNSDSFDLSFLFALCVRTKITPPSLWTIDLLPLVRVQLKGQVPNNKLGTVYRHFFGEDIHGAHSAVEDARATLRIASRLDVNVLTECSCDLREQFWLYRERLPS
jgi:DNA polymerase III epsilon subunit-like protein